MIPVLSTQTLLLLMFVSLCAGFVDGVAGGGGLLTVPALLTVGLPPHIVLGTSKLAGTLGVSSSAWTYIKKGIFNPLYWKAAITASLIGASFGVLANHILSANILKKLLPIVIVGVAIYMLWPKAKNTFNSQINFKPNKFSSSLVASVLSFYDGFIGPGTGSFWVTAVMSIYKLDMVTASGIARFMNLTSSLVALITFISLNSVDYHVGLLMGLGFMLGSYQGAHYAIRFGARFIKPIFMVVVIILAINLGYMEWFH
jgi:uncharacterized protein